MPWKETCAMDERTEMLSEYRKGEVSVAEICRRCGVSPKTGYKWIVRYESEGFAYRCGQTPAERPSRTDASDLEERAGFTAGSEPQGSTAALRSIPKGIQ
jgi:transposase